jgi:hypothetical protein
MAKTGLEQINPPCGGGNAIAIFWYVGRENPPKIVK